MATCSTEDICKRLGCLESDMTKVWDKVFGNNERVFLATGNIGIPTNWDRSENSDYFEADVQDYSRGAALLNTVANNGIFLVGGMDYERINIDNFDEDEGINVVPNGEYNQITQESKIIAGFAQAFNERRLFPVMGNYDFWPATGWAFSPEGDITAKMARTVLHLFNYLPDAKRYYSIYDDESSTEFFILSSGRYSDYYYPDGEGSHANGFIYPNDVSLVGDQYAWFSSKCSSSPARNKVVIFACPFVSPVNAGLDPVAGSGTNLDGNDLVFTDFELWDFSSFGVRLIINGHSGNSFHLKRGSLNVVNASAFSRSRAGLILSGSGEAVPYPPITYGQSGWVFDYFSYRPIGVPVDGISVPSVGDPLENYILPKQEFFKMTCTKDGIKCEFISYDPALPAFTDVVASMKTEHEFYISA